MLHHKEQLSEDAGGHCQTEKIMHDNLWHKGYSTGRDGVEQPKTKRLSILHMVTTHEVLYCMLLSLRSRYLYYKLGSVLQKQITHRESTFRNMRLTSAKVSRVGCSGEVGGVKLNTRLETGRAWAARERLRRQRLHAES